LSNKKTDTDVVNDLGEANSESRRIFGIHAIVDALKFSIVTTGGDGTALSRKFAEWTVQLTADADGNAPTNEDEAVTIYLYYPGGMAGHHKCGNAEEARRWLVEFVAFVADGKHGGDPDHFGWDFSEDAALGENER
jgi:hypothetical protein